VWGVPPFGRVKIPPRPGPPVPGYRKNKSLDDVKFFGLLLGHNIFGRN
jgi:hypothetical protein